MQFCGCSSHVERSDVHVYLASIRCSPDTLLRVRILTKSPVLEKKHPTRWFKHDFRYHLGIYQPSYSIKRWIGQSLTPVSYLKLDCSWQSKVILLSYVTEEFFPLPVTRLYFTAISHSVNAKHTYMIIGPGKTGEHTGPSHLLVSLSPSSWRLRTGCPAESSRWPSAVKGSLPLQTFFYATGRKRDEFHFTSGLQGEQLSCLEQGWDALNRGEGWQLWNSRFWGAGRQIRSLQPLLSLRKHGGTRGVSQRSHTRITVLLSPTHALSSVQQHHSGAHTVQKGQSSRGSEAGCAAQGSPPSFTIIAKL